MDVWSFEDNNHNSNSGIDDNHVSEILPDGVNFVETAAREFFNSTSHSQLDELNMLMDSMDSTSKLNEELWFLQPNLLCNSPVQIHNEQSLLPRNKTQTSSDILMNQQSNSSFSVEQVEEMEITKAMVFVISSSSSSSSSLSSSSKQRAQIHQSSFHPYNSSMPPKLKIQKHLQSQNMIKKAHNMLRNVNMLKGEQKREETASNSAHQMQHLVLERRRRERLNASFHSLWQLLPPGAKKDKTSVLCNTVSYMRVLKAEITELEEKNRILEKNLLPNESELGEESTNTDERIQVKISKSTSETESEMHQIKLVIMVGVQCDVIRVVLRVLECIKSMKDFNLLSLDTIPNIQQNKLFATLKLNIQGSTWDERTFKEAVTAAAQMGLHEHCLQSNTICDPKSYEVPTLEF